MAGIIEALDLLLLIHAQREDQRAELDQHKGDHQRESAHRGQSRQLRNKTLTLGQAAAAQSLGRQNLV